MVDIKVSVIMASFLGEYPGCASNRDKKFIRAVKSFINQTYQNKELIIVADGCELTKKLYEENFSSYENIKCILIPKQTLFSGVVRTIGLVEATGDYISYLDNDDVINKTHLEVIVNQFATDIDLYYYDDYLVLNKEFSKFQKRFVEIRYGQIGSSSIFHKNIRENWMTWENGYGHDFLFIMKIIQNGMKFKKLDTAPTYYVCHYYNADF